MHSNLYFNAKWMIQKLICKEFNSQGSAAIGKQSRTGWVTGPYHKIIHNGVIQDRDVELGILNDSWGVYFAITTGFLYTILIITNKGFFKTLMHFYACFLALYFQFYDLYLFIHVFNNE